jgi:transposase
MPSDTPSPKNQVSRLEVVSVGARQRWSDERKRELVLETFEPGARVNAVARRGGVATSLLFSWRKQLRDELGFPEAKVKLAPRFLPVAITEPAAAPTIELETRAGIRMKFSGAIDADVLVAIVKSLSRP